MHGHLSVKKVWNMSKRAVNVPYNSKHYELRRMLVVYVQGVKVRS